MRLRRNRFVLPAGREIFHARPFAIELPGRQIEDKAIAAPGAAGTALVLGTIDSAARDMAFEQRPYGTVAAKYRWGA